MVQLDSIDEREWFLLKEKEKNRSTEGCSNSMTTPKPQGQAESMLHFHAGVVAHQGKPE